MKSLFGRVALAGAGLAALLLYVALVDVGMHAGRVHRGVTVTGVDIGGLTELEAFEVLRERQALLEEVPVVLIADGFDCRAEPADFGWDPKPFNTAQDAMEVGRNGVLDGLRERIDAWLGGVKVGWAGTVDPAEVSEFLDYCEETAKRLTGAVVDRAKLRYRIRRAIVTYPRSAIDFKVPLVRDAGT